MLTGSMPLFARIISMLTGSMPLFAGIICLLTPNHSVRTCGGPEVLTSTTFFSEVWCEN